MLKMIGFAGLLVSVACGSSSNGGGNGVTTGSGSCTTTDSGGMLVSCIDFGVGFTATTAMQRCTAPATYSATACPSANRVGRCEITATNGSVTAEDAVSFYPPVTAAQGQSACAMENGVVAGVMTTWVPG